MYINNTPHRMTRHGHLVDLVFPTMHTEQEKTYYRPAVGDYIVAPPDATIQRLNLESMNVGQAQVIAQQDGKTYSYKGLDDEEGLLWAQYIASLNPDSDVQIQMHNTRFYKVVVPNTHLFYAYIGLMASKSPNLHAYMIDATLQDNVYKSLLRSRVLTGQD